LSGVFIDIDHVLDYFLNHGFTFTVRRFYDCCINTDYETLTLLFHSYELILVFWGVIFLFSLGAIWKAAAAGATIHLFLDHARNMSSGKMGVWTYFLVYRLMNRFQTERIVKKR